MPELGYSLSCEENADRWLEAVAEFETAEYDHVYIHQIGPEQEGFLEFAKRELLPRV